MIKTKPNLKALSKPLTPQLERAITKQVNLIHKEMLGEIKGRPTLADSNPHPKARRRLKSKGSDLK